MECYGDEVDRESSKCFGGRQDDAKVLGWRQKDDEDWQVMCQDAQEDIEISIGKQGSWFEAV